MRKTLVILLLLTASIGCLRTAADRKISPTVVANEFWRHMVWQRYDALHNFVSKKDNKKLRTWLGPKREPGIRFLESKVEDLQMPGEATAEVTYFLRYYLEPEYVEEMTSVTQTWERIGRTWRLTGGYPLENREAVQPK